MDDNKQSSRLIAIGLLAEQNGHRLLQWIPLPSGVYQSFCKNCLDTIWVGEAIISFLENPCPITHVSSNKCKKLKGQYCTC